jgi:hypothetical protein
MKYSTNLPKRTYTTTIGDFDLVDLSSYYVFDDTNAEKMNISVDKSQTLIETSYSTYGDVDSIWMFLFANKKINPFTLTKLDAPTALAKVKNFTALGLEEDGPVVDAITTNGSILVDRVTNSGATWDYGSTGNFSLTGGFALVDSVNTFSKRAVVKEANNIQLTENAVTYFLLNRSSNGSYSIYNASKTIGISQAIARQSLTNSTKFEQVTPGRITTNLNSELPVLIKGNGSAYTPQGTGVTFSFEEDVQNQNIDIFAYDITTISFTNLIQINQNYVV